MPTSLKLLRTSLSNFACPLPLAIANSKNNSLRDMPRKTKHRSCRMIYTGLTHAWHELVLDDFYANIHRFDRIIDRNGKDTWGSVLEWAASDPTLSEGMRPAPSSCQRGGCGAEYGTFLAAATRTGLSL